MSGSRIFCQFYLVLSLFYSLKRGSNGFIAEKTIQYLYFTKDPEAVHYFPGTGGVQLFPGGGVQMLISTCYFPGGVSGPPFPLYPHMGNVIITGQYLSQSSL